MFGAALICSSNVPNELWSTVRPPAPNLTSGDRVAVRDSLRRFDSLADRFQASYKAGTQQYSTERVSLYEAISYFKLARTVALVHRPPGWERIGAALLSEALRVLGGTHSEKQ